MKFVGLSLAPLFVLLAFSGATAEVLSGTGQGMNIDIGYGLKVNEGSTLEKQWVIVNDERLPVRMTNLTMRTMLDDRNWAHTIFYEVEINEPIQAIEVRFIPFDIWGDRGRVLSATEITDLEIGSETLSAKWRIISENEAVEQFAVLGYIARIKLASGELLRTNPDLVVTEAQKFSKDFTSVDLDAIE